MASKEELLEKNLDELKEMAKDADLEGRSKMGKEELAEALADDSSSDEADADESAVLDAEASEEAAEERLETVEEEAGPVAAELSAHEELDVQGPLVTGKPSERIMTGAVSEEHAEEQAELLANQPEDYVGDVSEAGFDEDGRPAESEGAESSFRAREDSPSKSDPDRTYGELRAEGLLDQRDVVDYDAQRQVPEADAPMREEGSVFANSAVAGNPNTGRSFGQKAVFYTDGLSGGAEQNLERAYEIPELLQSNDPAEREAGDESLSEAAKEAKSEEEKEHAEAVKTRDDE